MHLVEQGSTFTLMHGLPYITSFLLYVPKSYVCTLTYCTCTLVSIMWQWQYTLRDLFLCDPHIPTLVYSNFVVSHKSLIVPSNLLALNESLTAVHALIASNLQMSLYVDHENLSRCGNVQPEPPISSFHYKMKHKRGCFPSSSVLYW